MSHVHAASLVVCVKVWLFVDSSHCVSTCCSFVVNIMLCD